MHGEIRKARSTIDDNLIYDIDGWELKIGDLCEKKSQLRPHVVWFGESVDNIMPAAEIAETADIFLVIGTSLVVYPAAGLINHIPEQSKKYLVDLKATPMGVVSNLEIIRKKADEGVPELVEELLKSL